VRRAAWKYPSSLRPRIPDRLRPSLPTRRPRSDRKGGSPSNPIAHVHPDEDGHHDLRNRLLPRSTARQDKSGLGIEAQKAAIQRFAEAEGIKLIAEHVEVETGKGADALERRPELAAALAQARKENARSSSPSSIA
jgi:hypothetical protein